ncbi:BMA_0021/BMA_0022 family TOMM bacteriocin [Sorangium sp. So ce1036]|uniref:BMA_0021/BMA_0022 family TOMM bacteriocin n=1 Tax=Sorangium sp. So ce1036 TaxID=3133328 RepID=UPI003EFD7C0E
MIEFRTAYLRAIARVWREGETSDFAKDLTSGIQSKIDQCLSECGFSADCWPNLCVQFVRNGGVQWNPGDTGGWFSPVSKHESLTLRLPLDKAKVLHGVDQRYWAQALAEFYQLFPTPFGPIADPSQSGTKESTHQSLMAYPTKLGDFHSFLELGGVIARAIALAWRQQASGDMSFTHDLMTRAAGALQSWLGYISPWGIDLRVEPAPDGVRWIPPTDDASAGAWACGATREGESLPLEDYLRNTLTLCLPDRPGKDATVWPIALAAYNNTGPAYPFTCCPA